MCGFLCFACITSTPKTIPHLDNKPIESRGLISSAWTLVTKQGPGMVVELETRFLGVSVSIIESGDREDHF